jgi:hypothetical protein
MALMPEERDRNRDIKDFIETLAYFGMRGGYDGSFAKLVSGTIRDEVRNALKNEIPQFMAAVVAGLNMQKDPELVNCIQASLPRARVSSYQINKRECPFCQAKSINVMTSSAANSKGSEKVRKYKCSACGKTWPSLEIFFK